MAATSSKVTLFCLHFLGGSARSWRSVAAALGSQIDCRPLDLTGFGAAAAQAPADVATMAADVASQIRVQAPSSWWIAGHSMGAKVAMAVGRQAEDGETGLGGFSGIALVAGSPPCPEPMEDAKRADLLSWIDASEDVRRANAREYIRENVGAPLGGGLEESVVEDVLCANPAAWKAWLEIGSRENWRDAIGRIRAPAVVLSGSKDEALGPTVQELLMMPHLDRGSHTRIEGAGHLLPLERPGEVAGWLRQAMRA